MSLVIYHHHFLAKSRRTNLKSRSKVHLRDVLDPRVSRYIWILPSFVPGLVFMQYKIATYIITFDYRRTLSSTECFLISTVVALKFIPISKMYPTPPHPSLFAWKLWLRNSTSTCSEAHNVHFSRVVVEGYEAIMALPPPFHEGNQLIYEKE